MLACCQASILLFLKETQQKTIRVILIAVHVADSSTVLGRVSVVPRTAECYSPSLDLNFQ